MYIVAALYHFTRFADPAALKPALEGLAQSHGVKGSLLLAREGVNGTIAGPRAGIDAVLAHIRAWPGCGDLEWKESSAPEMPFGRMKVRLKREIVTMGIEDVDPRARVGHYVEPSDWNALIASDDTVVIDTRNDYEVEIGTFQGAIDPQTKTFREFPDWWRENAHRFHNKRVAMFCTGGIRCEKATNFLISEGVEDVYHLKGGILKYLEEVPQAESRWDGDCFVFDGRVSLRHGLEIGEYDSCHACRRPVSAEDKTRPEFEQGVSCHRCIATFSDADRARFRERERQIRLAAERGEPHLGRD
ncbi:hypothetical protein DL1_02620 [Thioclava dalianensis]|uniref:tRNA uridine(34) hydroxylase n=1 Tax=Thioclava dalianensis TaxID=1185766 RepID=A0A074U525_9RHOB|nr:rhodanese-related sulfurtransferase [Thioclava dalianensis]KEP69727.1 hypothetical protein DL1_02620 [Thioclava dalianensis]SFM93615.1 UPF0176 protein [Thioclava dalianensis]